MGRKNLLMPEVLEGGVQAICHHLAGPAAVCSRGAALYRTEKHDKRPKRCAAPQAGLERHHSSIGCCGHEVSRRGHRLPEPNARDPNDLGTRRRGFECVSGLGHFENR